MSMWNNENLIKKLGVTFWGIGILVYFLSVVWVNLNGRQWYHFDIYSDAQVARIMAEEATLFPSNWTFGNQYYVVATPVVASIIYSFIHDSFYALAIASCIMMIIVYAVFIWCLKPFISKSALIAGLFCISGAIILGSSASTYENGFQIFYTMASYYSCYMIGMLYTLGVYFRLSRYNTVKKYKVGIALFLNFALGMQSLRETIILNIPLIIVAIYQIKSGEYKNCRTFPIIALVANVCGVILANLLPISNNSIISSAYQNGFIENVKTSLYDFFSINGLAFITFDGLKSILLFTLAIFINIAVLYSLIRVVYTKDMTPVGIAIIFCAISLSGVFISGVFIIKTRPIYFFMWYFLAIFSIIYCINLYEKDLKKYVMFCFLLLLCGGVNYLCNFYIDYNQFSARNNFYQKITNQLRNEGIEFLYTDWRTPPIIPAFSDDQIQMGVFTMDVEEKYETLTYPIQYLQKSGLFNEQHERKSYVVFSNASIEYIKNEAPSKYRDELLSHLNFIREEIFDNQEILRFYRIKC